MTNLLEKCGSGYLFIYFAFFYLFSDSPLVKIILKTHTLAYIDPELFLHKVNCHLLGSIHVFWISPHGERSAIKAFSVAHRAHNSG